MRVPFRAGQNANDPTVGTPEVLQDFRYFTSPNNGRVYDGSLDGERLVVIRFDAADSTPRQIHVVLNWVRGVEAPRIDEVNVTA